MVRGGLPRRTIAALGAGFIITTCLVVLFGPTLGGVAADEQDQRILYLKMLGRGDGGGRATSYAPSPARTPLRVLFGSGSPYEQRLPANVRSYAPPDAPLDRPARSRDLARMSSPARPATSGAALSRRSVCVRLCDGFAFPVADYAGESDNATHSAICAGMCPGAPTRLYVQPAGSDRLDDTQSTRDRKPYSALPVAFRYTKVRDETCSCHPPGASTLNNISLLRDFTLRAGDTIMTERGFRVFQGASGWPYRRDNFATLARSGIGKSEIGRLGAMERASRRAQTFAARGKPGADAPVLTIGAPAARPVEKSVRLLGPRVFLSQKSDAIVALP